MSAHYPYIRLYRALRYGNTEDVKEAVFFLGEEADLQLSLCSNFGACGTAAYYGQIKALDTLIELGYSNEEERRKRAIQQYWRVIMYTGDYDMARHLVDKYQITIENVERIFPKSTDPWDGQEFDQYMYADFACRGHFKALALACESGILEKPIPSTVQVVLGEALENGHHHIRELGDLFLHSSGYRSWIRGLEPLQKAIFMKTSIPKDVRQLANNPVEASNVVGEASKLAARMNDPASVRKVLDLAQKLGLDKSQMADLCCDEACAHGSINVLKCLRPGLTPEVIGLLFEVNPSILDHEKLKEIPFMKIATNEKWLELLEEHRPDKFNNVRMSSGSYMDATCLHLLRYSDDFRRKVQNIQRLGYSKFLDYFPNDCKLEESLDFLKVDEDDDFDPEFRMTDLNAMNKVFRHMAGLRLQWPEFVTKFENLPKATKLHLIDALYLHGIQIISYSLADSTLFENWAKKWSSTARIRWKFRPVLPLKALCRRAVRIHVRASRLEVPMCSEDKVLSLHTKLPRPLVDYLLFREPNSNFQNKHRSN